MNWLWNIIDNYNDDDVDLYHAKDCYSRGRLTVTEVGWGLEKWNVVKKVDKVDIIRRIVEWYNSKETDDMGVCERVYESVSIMVLWDCSVGGSASKYIPLCKGIELGTHIENSIENFGCKLSKLVFNFLLQKTDPFIVSILVISYEQKYHF